MRNKETIEYIINGQPEQRNAKIARIQCFEFEWKQIKCK